MKKLDSKTSSSILSSYEMGLCEQEERVSETSSSKKFIISIPKDVNDNEKRVLLTPEGVEILVEDGYKIIIEKGAGEKAGFSDVEYSGKGATIVDTPEESHKGDIVLKLNHPTVSEAKMIPSGRILVSNLYRKKDNAESLKALMKRKISCIAIERISQQLNGSPIRNTIFPIEGKAIMLMAAELLTNERGGRGMLLGGIAGVSPVEIIIIGAGIVAEYAAQVALVLGATVKIFSSSLDSLFAMKQKLGQSLFTNMLHSSTLYKALSTADVVINTINFEEDDASFDFNEDMFKLLKKGTIVLDMSVRGEDYFESPRQAGQNSFLYNKYGINYHCIVNISSRVARTSSIALNNVIIDIVNKITNQSNFIQVLREDEGLRHGVYIFNGILTDIQLGRKFNIPSQDIDLLLAAF